MTIYAALLAVVCLLVFAPAYNAGITNWDDDSYLIAPAAQRISLQTFTATVFGSYQPLTILSFAVEQQLFGRNALILHATNVVLHAATTVFVFLLLLELTGLPFGSFAGALIWAIHPLRVESVIWIAERKDVLCALFFVAALLTYVRRRMAWTYVLFVLALLSKGAAISLPLAMLTIDYLQRRRAIVEKIPFFTLSVVFGIIGYLAQRGEGASPQLPGFAFSTMEKIALSCETFLFYLGKLLFPVRLSAFYPYPATVTWFAPLFVAVIAAIVGLTTRFTRAIAFAFLFFVVTIAYILPIVSLGHTIAADRFTYIPSIGFAYAIALVAKPKTWPIVAAIAVVLGVLTFDRSRVWHDSVSLWNSVIEVEPELATAYNSRGVALVMRGDFGNAVRDFDRAIALDPCYLTAIRNRMIIALRFGDQRAAAAARDKLLACRK
jgi:protein O-mannosyl-transferase